MSIDPIPISAVRLDGEVEESVLGVLRSGQLAQGPMVEELEREFVRVVGVEHAVAVSSGTAALAVALEALGIGPGDEVVTSPFTFVATLNAILERGATVRFVDIDPTDFTMDPELLDDAVGNRTRVIMPVHLFGQAAAMGPILAAADRVGAHVVEDAAQALGATVDGRSVGSFGCAAFSLYATKNITTGEGGVVTTDDAVLADRIRLLRNQGMRTRYAYEVPGHNYRLTDVQAAIGVPQLRRLHEITATRVRNAELLTAGLLDIPGLVVPTVRDGRTHVYHQYTVRVTDEALLGRDHLAEQLLDAGIGSGIYYPRVVYDYEPYRDHPGVVSGPAPQAERAAQQVLSLPVHQFVEPDGINRVVDAMRRLLVP